MKLLFSRAAPDRNTQGDRVTWSGSGQWPTNGFFSSEGNGSERNHGRVYATSMAVLSLSVKYHYLPIYQK